MKHVHLFAAASLAAVLCAHASARSPQEHGTRQLTWTDFDVDVTIPANVSVYGRFTVINLVSGTCLAYHI